jgi:hypothetical protein
LGDELAQLRILVDVREAQLQKNLGRKGEGYKSLVTREG